MFVINVNADNIETGIARVDTMQDLRVAILQNMATGDFTEVTILNLRQLETVVKRVLGH